MSSRYLGLRRLILVAFCCGCGSSAPTSETIPTVRAQGVLLYKGKPLAFHQLKLLPDDQRPATAITDADGQFVLGTNRPGDGAVPGTHRLAVVYTGDPNDNPATKGIVTGYTPPPPPSIRIDRKYQKAETSEVSVEIPPEGDSDLTIDLQ